MGFLKNKKTKRFLGIYVFIQLIFIIIAFCYSLIWGLLTLLSVLISLFFLCYFLYTRSKRIYNLALTIDKILHNDLKIHPGDYNDDEFSMLYDEIYKMTVRLREQSEILSNDKIFLSDSIADISHQIRTPLTSINLILSILRNPNTAAERKYELYNDIYILCNRIDSLITSLLKISKIDAGMASFVNNNYPINDVITKSVDPLLIQLDLRNQSLIWDKTNNPNIFCDINWLSEAIGNIIKNCSEHSGNDGIIKINVTDNTIYTLIQISDNGGGIQEKDLPHIFERFYKGSNSSENSYGVGLALAKMIITNQNGVVSAKNKDDGALFQIKIYKINSI
ncbi:HAMP domain-containing histidine kinase [Eubacteriales bacterium OttesenSCG-928-G02]|nr:HAMP domain-containing histidine kinase [Eubacteriales bacterium OttesenSCG-928-G02]